MAKEYIGDGVYAEYDGFGTVLTSENGESVLAEIYLEPSTLADLTSYVTREVERAKAAYRARREQPEAGGDSHE